MKKKNGFTLIELLAVIIILGVLMLVAIPSVTSYINNSRKESYIDTAKQYIKGATVLVNSGELDMFDTDTTYYIPCNCINLETGGDSPFGKFDPAYIVVTYDNNSYAYYWVSRDTAGQGIKTITNSNDLNSKLIKAGIKEGEITTNVSVGDRENILVIDSSSCSSMTSSPVEDYVDEGGGEGPSSVVYPDGKTKSDVTIGDIVKIGDEDFYVVKRNGNRLALLARYNLKVGAKITSSGGINGYYSTSDSGYGKQSSEARGYVDGDSIYYGGVTFSDTNYWKDNIGDNLSYPGFYCTNSNHVGCAYVYDSNSSIKSYVDSYANGLPVSVKKARLLTLEEAYAFVNAGKYNELANTTFWLGSPSGDNFIWTIRTNKQMVTNYYSLLGGVGIRPVIEI